ncbi:MAG: helix-turn-helix domain-containing protein [Gammaproteobacteria bacterium]
MSSEHLPDYAFAHIDAEDVAVLEAVSNEDGFDVLYRQISSGSYHGQISAALYNETLLLKEQHNQSVHFGGTCPLEDYTLAVILDGQPQKTCGNELGLSDLILAQPCTSFDFMLQKNVQLGYMQIPQESLHKICSAIGIKLDQLDQYLFRANPNLVQQLAQVMQLALQPISSTDDPAHVQKKSLMTEQQIFGAIINVFSSIHFYKSEPDPYQSASAKARLARRVRDCMEASPDNPLKMLDLCDELNCKLRTLQHAFSSYFDIAPGTYHRKIRMNEARRTLLRAEPDTTTVTNIANQHGFWHLGRFALDYKQLFDESPSQSLAIVKPGPAYTSLRQAMK